MPGRESRVMLKAAGVAGVLFFFAGLASAQIPSRNIFLGFSYERTNSTAFSGSNLVTTTFSHPNLHGWEASFEGKVLPLVGIVGDVSGHYGSQSFVEVTPNGPQSINVTGHEQEYLVGPRLSIPVGKFTPFAELMVGAAHIHTGGLCPVLPTPRSPTHWAEAWIIGFFVPSRCASKATTCARSSSARVKTISHCRQALSSAFSRERIRRNVW